MSSSLVLDPEDLVSELAADISLLCNHVLEVSQLSSLYDLLKENQQQK